MTRPNEPSRDQAEIDSLITRRVTLKIHRESALSLSAQLNEFIPALDREINQIDERLCVYLEVLDRGEVYARLAESAKYLEIQRFDVYPAF